MISFKYFKTYVLALIICANSSVMAQERAAGGTADLQMTWSALSNLAKAAQAKADEVNSRVDQVVACGAKGMVYSPGANGVDWQGCVNPKNTIDTTNYDRMLSCANQGLVYQSSSNSCIIGQANRQAPNCQMQIRNSIVNGTNKYGIACSSDTVPILTRTISKEGSSTNSSGSWTHNYYDCYAVVCQ